MDKQSSAGTLNIVTPENPDYAYWNNRSANARLQGAPHKIIPVDSVAELVIALQQTVNDNQRLAIRGGGHCLENFVSDPAVEVIIDISRIKGIRYDAELNAIEIMCGVTLGEMHEKLYADWGVVLPSGEHPAIGIGGHIQGGAFGFICRQHGLGVDYLYALEVLVVNNDRQVKTVFATREADDPNRELWWAHTGGGAGNFGVVTRYWFRSAGADSKYPSQLLPKAPRVVETLEVDWPWEEMTDENFAALVNNFCNWSYQNASPESPALSLFATLHLWNRTAKKIQLKAVLIDETNSAAIIYEFLQSLSAGINIRYQSTRKKMSWIEFALHPFPDIFTEGKGSFKVKDAFLLKPFTTEQLKTIYYYLTSMPEITGGFLGLATYGGKVNAVPVDATASFQRSAILTTSCTAGWVDPKEEKKHLAWVRDCYNELYKDAGGVPVPNNQTGGCIIAHPDNDLANVQWNRSGVPWWMFYYQDHYPRLQRVKSAWDPLNIFRHSLSVQAT